MALRITRTTYRYEYPDGSVTLKTMLRCPKEGCGEEFDGLQGLALHAGQVHGLQMDCPSPPDSGKVATQKVTRLKLPNGDFILVCPLCQEQFPSDEAQFLEHLAASHGRALTAPGGRLGGESEQLDMLHRASADGHYARLSEAQQQLQLVSLGSFCGMKFSIQRLGLGDAHLPFDWIRTTSQGLERFLKHGFDDFFVAKRYDLPEDESSPG